MPDFIYTQNLPYTQIPVWLFLYVVIGVILGYFVIRQFNKYAVDLINYLLSKVPGEKPRDIQKISKNTLVSALILSGVNIIAKYHIQGNQPNIWLIQNPVYKILVLITFISFVLIVSKHIKYFLTIYLHNRDKLNGLNDKPVDVTVRSLFTIILNIALYIFSFFQILAILQIKPTSLVASASVTAIILGFALQNVLADIFSSLSLYLDQPFKVGDNIKVGNESGKVLKIGFKSTRIKTEHGEELSISNVELSKAQIKNFEKLRRRMVELEIELARNTKKKKQEPPNLPSILEDVANELEQVQLDHCTLAAIAKEDFLYKAQYFALTSSLKEHRQIKDAFIRLLMKKLKEEKIEIKSFKQIN